METYFQNPRVILHQTKQVLKLCVITQNIKVSCACISGSIQERLQFGIYMDNKAYLNHY